MSLATLKTEDPFGIWHDSRGYAVVALKPLCTHKHKTSSAAFKCAARIIERRMGR